MACAANAAVRGERVPGWGLATYTLRHGKLSEWIAFRIAGSVANSEIHRAVADSESRTRVVVETAAAGIMTTNDNLEIQSTNGALLNIFGYPRSVLPRRRVSDLAGEPYKSDHHMFGDRYRKTGVQRRFGALREVAGQRKDGTTFLIKIEATRTELEHGVMYTGPIRDITDRENAED